MKIPRTLHIEGSRMPAGKSDPEAIQFSDLKGQFLVVEEKVDGTGVSIFLDHQLNLQIWHRGSPAIGKEYHHLHEWANNHWEDFACLLGERYMLFGEWMYNKHTIFYDKLPHFFLESDVYDRERDVWLSTSARNELLKGHKYIKQVPVIAALKPSSLEQLTCLIGKSQYISTEYVKNLQLKCLMSGTDYNVILKETDLSGLMEGIYLKQEDDFKVINRYKFVRYDFVNKIINSGTHIRDRIPISNMISSTPGLL